MSAPTTHSAAAAVAATTRARRTRKPAVEPRMLGRALAQWRDELYESNLWALDYAERVGAVAELLEHGDGSDPPADAREALERMLAQLAADLCEEVHGMAAAALRLVPGVKVPMRATT